VVCGLGGAGKSQLMLGYVEVFKDDYTATFWIDASSKERLEADYKQIHNLLLRPGRDDTDIDTCVAEVRQWCHRRRTRRYLFILDSADGIEDMDLQRYIVDAASVDVAITTRIQSAKEMTDLEAVQVAELAPTESREIFIRRLALIDPSLEVQSEIDAVTEELGHFALAVSLAAAYVASTRRLKAHPAGYLVEYAERKRTLLARKPRKHIDQYGESVLTTWETSYAAIASHCPEACNMLTFLSFLSSSNIFTELLHSSYEDASGILASMILIPASENSLQDTLDDGFKALELYSLLQWNDQHEAYSMHKLVHTWAFERLESDEKDTFCFAAWNYLERLCWRNLYFPAMHWRLIPHVMACFVKVRALCHVRSLATEDVVGLVSSLATFLHTARRLDFAYVLQLFSHQYHEQHRFVDSMIHARSLYNLACILGAQHNYGGEEQLLRQVLDGLNEPLSKEHVRMKELCQLSLAVLLMNRDKPFSEAEQTIRSLLYQQWQRNASANDIAHTIVGLARALERQERHREAEILYKLMLKTPEELGSLARNALTTDLSRTLLHQGKLAEAEEVAQREYKHALNYGVTDSRLQTALMTLGEVKLAQKAYAEAATLLGQACDATGNPDHPGHLECQFLLARTLAHLCLYDRALATYARAIDGYGRVLGLEDPFTRTYTRELDSFRAFLADREASKADTEHMRQDPED
jgi:tetratricopeptide (TPR) repeat protein